MIAFIMKWHRAIGILMSFIILILYIAEVMPVSTLIYIVIGDVVLMLIFGNIVFPIYREKHQKQEQEK